MDNDFLKAFKIINRNSCADFVDLDEKIKIEFLIKSFFMVSNFF